MCGRKLEARACRRALVAEHGYSHQYTRVRLLGEFLRGSLAVAPWHLRIQGYDGQRKEDPVGLDQENMGEDGLGPTNYFVDDEVSLHGW